MIQTKLREHRTGLVARAPRRLYPGFPVHYRGHFIGKLVPDLIVDGKVIADPKVVSAFNDTHIAQMLGYLNITGLEVALLLNFNESTLTWKRVVRGFKEKELTTDDTDRKELNP